MIDDRLHVSPRMPTAQLHCVGYPYLGPAVQFRHGGFQVQIESCRYPHHGVRELTLRIRLRKGLFRHRATTESRLRPGADVRPRPGPSSSGRALRPYPGRRHFRSLPAVARGEPRRKRPRQSGSRYAAPGWKWQTILTTCVFRLNPASDFGAKLPAISV